MPRAGLTTEAVVAAAAEVVDTAGPDSLTLAALAERLGVRSPSLYHHVDGLDDLRRRVAILAIDLLGDALGSAVMGRSGGDALDRLARAYRRFSHEHPGLYALTQGAHRDDPERAVVAGRVLEPVMAVLAGYRLTDTAAVHAARILRSALHGFVVLEAESGFGLDVDVDDTFEHLLRFLEAGLETV